MKGISALEKEAPESSLTPAAMGGSGFHQTLNLLTM